MAMAINEQAIRTWIATNRPDLKAYMIDSIMENEGVFGMMAMAFEAGRTFQKLNPEADEFPEPDGNYRFK